MGRGGSLAITASVVLHLAVVAVLARAPATMVSEPPPMLEVMLTPSPVPHPARLKSTDAGRGPTVPSKAAPRPEASKAIAAGGASSVVSPLSVQPPAERAEAAAAATLPTPESARPVIDPFDAWSRLVWAALDRRRPRAEAGASAARVAFSLDLEGHLTGLRLAVSSGSPIFDREAMRSVRAAAPFPRPPQGIDPQRLRFEVLVLSSGGQAAAAVST